MVMAVVCVATQFALEFWSVGRIKVDVDFKLKLSWRSEVGRVD